MFIRVEILLATFASIFVYVIIYTRLVDFLMKY